MFSGKRAFEGPRRRHAASLNSLVSDVDPTLECVILRCLSERPCSRRARSPSPLSTPGG